MKFKKKSLLEIRNMTIDEVSKYYVELRKYEYDNKIPLKGINIRNKIHKLLVELVRIERKLNDETLMVINDERVKSENSKIYVCTHAGGNDIQRTFEAIKEPAYLFLGDPKEAYRDATGLLLYFNGVICMESSDKTDRKIAKERAIELLNKGGNLLIYPEGAWNITPNLPVMKLFKGAVTMAKETGADIIPVAIEQYENNFFVSIGKNIIMDDVKDMSIVEINHIVRNMMATQKWNIWERMGTHSRKNVACTTLEEFQEEIVNKCEYDFTIQDVLDTMYKDKNTPTYEEVFKPVKEIVKKKSSN